MNLRSADDRERHGSVGIREAKCCCLNYFQIRSLALQRYSCFSLSDANFPLT